MIIFFPIRNTKQVRMGTESSLEGFGKSGWASQSEMQSEIESWMQFQIVELSGSSAVSFHFRVCMQGAKGSTSYCWSDPDTRKTYALRDVNSPARSDWIWWRRFAFGAGHLPTQQSFGALHIRHVPCAFILWRIILYDLMGVKSRQLPWIRDWNCVV